LTLLDKIVYLKRSIYWKHKKRRRASLIRKWRNSRENLQLKLDKRDSPTFQPSVSSNSDELIIIIVIYDALDMSLVFSFSLFCLSRIWFQFLWYHLFLFLSLSPFIRRSTHIRLIRKSSLYIHIYASTWIKQSDYCMYFIYSGEKKTF
jgi:hypothetical protein